MPQPWAQLQALRRGALPVQPWIDDLVRGAVAPDPLLLAALWGRLDRPAVQCLLGSPLGLDPSALLTAGRRELPLLASEPAVQQAWLEPCWRTFHPAPRRGPGLVGAAGAVP